MATSTDVPSAYAYKLVSRANQAVPNEVDLLAFAKIMVGECMEEAKQQEMDEAKNENTNREESEEKDAEAKDGKDKDAKEELRGEDVQDMETLYGWVEGFRKNLKSQWSWKVTKKASNEVVGFIIWQKSRPTKSPRVWDEIRQTLYPTDDKRDWEIHFMWVLKDHRGKGLGTGLMRRSIRDLKDQIRGKTIFAWTVEPERFFHKFGLPNRPGLEKSDGNTKLTAEKYEPEKYLSGKTP